VASVRLLGDARRSIDAALEYTLARYGEEGVLRYAALITQAIDDFGAAPDARTVRHLGKDRNGQDLLRYDLALSRENVPKSVAKVANPRHFLVARLDGDLLRILFVAHDSMMPENVLGRARHSDFKDD
jgi:plasmid stabilization system protein ParE